MQWILEDSGAKLLFVEDQGHYTKHIRVIDETPTLKETLVIDEHALPTITKRGAKTADDELDRRYANSLSSDAATLIYTSGTTGRPKGVLLTHANFMAECAATRDAVGAGLAEGKTTLLFLPPRPRLSPRHRGGERGERRDPGPHQRHHESRQRLRGLQAALRAVGPARLREGLQLGEAEGLRRRQGSIFEKATDTAIEYSTAMEAGKIGLGLKLRHALFDKLVYGKLRAALGGQCEGAISGGAPLGARLGHFFRGVGIPVYEGYGLSETTAAVTANNEENQKVGSVGRPVPGVTIAIADDGEILLKGPVVFGGYWRNEAATADAIRDGWFHTGDIGTLDDGYLFITGRKKELIVTAGGKNVSPPAQLEDSIRAHPMVSQCLVVGDNKPFIAALITIDPEAVPGWLERHHLPADTPPLSTLIENADLKAEIDAAVKDANSKVSNAEAIKKFTILDTDFSIETGELTPTLKLKRNVVHDAHKQAIADLYT